MEYRKLKTEEIDREIFRGFERRQQVTKCWRKIDGKWQIKEAPFIDQWSEEEYGQLIQCLKNTILNGGVVFAAFSDGMLKGFSSVEPGFFGKKKEYLDLSCLHVSEEMRGHGIGKALFLLAADWAKDHGAQKLYISGHSAVETQAFYKAMGCVEAEEYNQKHVAEEPFDCQLELVL